MALQDPQGRHASFKTPSKVYEFLGCGKAVIATDVGDIAELGNDVLIVLPTLTPHAIAAALDKLTVDQELLATLRWRSRAYSEQNFSYGAVGVVLRALLLGVQEA